MNQPDMSPAAADSVTQAERSLLRVRDEARNAYLRLHALASDPTLTGDQRARCGRAALSLAVLLPFVQSVEDGLGPVVEVAAETQLAALAAAR